MIDLTGIPLPPGAPSEPGACVRVERPEPGIALVVLAPPHRKLAVLDAPLLVDLDRAVETLERDGSLRGVVITGREPLSFAAGADVDAIEAIDDPARVHRFVRQVQDLFERLAALAQGVRAVRTVAAVGGPVPGGAYELALACSRIVVADSPKTRIGLPETQLGIIPGWGGSQRLPRRIGVPAALDAILTGRLFDARSALRRGMVDRVTPPEILVRVATDIAAGRLSCKRRTRGAARYFIDKNPLAQAAIAHLTRKQVLARTKGHYPAPLKAIELVTKAPSTPLVAGFEAEARAIERLALGTVCKSLIGIFKLSEEAKKLGRLPDGDAPPPVSGVGVLGGGVMGAGIASLCALRGMPTRLFDIARAPLDRALIDHRGEVRRRAAKRRLAPAEALRALDALDASSELSGFSRADIVVEAVAERLEIKRDVLARVAAQVAPQAILATNTSSLAVSAIAAGLPGPERIVGMHFFNPVAKMPLVEIVRGEHTSDATVARTAALALRLGKTPVVVADVAGFLVNRLLGPYLDEALRLVQQGFPIDRLDPLVEEFGMPLGPLALLDEVGLDIAAHAAKSLHAAYGVRMTPADGIEALVAAGRLGKKSGRGFYDHTAGKGVRGKARKTLAADLRSIVPQRGDALAQLSDAEALDRLLLSMVNEAARCLAEDVVADAGMLDLATIFGMGFPPFRGGLLRWADTLGAGEIEARLARIAARPDVSARPGGVEKFTPSPWLVARARSGERLRG